jgi:hypothetical protein
MYYDAFDQKQQKGQGWGMQMKQEKKTDLGKAEEKEEVADAM